MRWQIVSDKAGHAGRGQILEGPVWPTKLLGLQRRRCQGLEPGRDVVGSMS